ncbi:unnamed protein product [Phyllotreta striolata]|uniref:ADP/ATP translocase n=1 Tax=Phyllotreta striolata TaxID=444603 RepID=A0A9N9TJB8_PHYSR|nr:unnamed protein product [Phyllotreta striolata]
MPDKGTEKSYSHHSGSNRSFMRSFLAGGISAGIVKTVTAPLERVKIILQLQAARKEYRTKDAYKGILDAFLRVPKDQGFLSLWQGNLANIIRYVPTQSLNFAFKSAYRKYFLGDGSHSFKHFLFVNVLAGGAAGSSAMLFVYPLDYARTALTLDMAKKGAKKEYSGIADCIVKTYKSDGLAGLYRGFVVSVQGIFIYRGAYFGLYDTAKGLLPDPKNSPFLVLFAIAQSVTTVAGLASYPFDTVRRRIMLQSNRKEEDRVYKSIGDCWVKIYREEGARGYFKGALSNILRGVAASLVLVFYDKIKNVV